MTLTAVQKAEMDRGLAGAGITQIEKKIATQSTVALTDATVKMLLEKVKKSQESIHEIHSRIMYQSPDNIDVHQTEFFNLMERLDTATTQLLAIQITQQPKPSSSSSSATSHIKIKLPDLKLPTFTGNYEDWPEFQDLFQADVGKDVRLSDSQRLQYLKGCLEGEPKTLVKSYTITDQNYAEAWSTLSTRYNNPREIQMAIANKLLSQPHSKSESLQSIKALLNTTMECIRSLKVLGQPTEHWDLLLVTTVTDRFDPDTKAEWVKTLKGTSLVTFKELSDFMESHIRALTAKGSVTTKVSSTTSTYSNKGSYSTKDKVRTFHVSAAPATCVMCKGSHHLYQCPKLLELEPAQRMSAVKRTTACLNCLRDGHSARDCSSKHLCRHCSRKHHTLLHSGEQQRNNLQQSSSSEGGSSQTTVRTHHAAASPQSASTQRMFKTAVVDIKDAAGVKRPCRVLYDDCSEAEYITERCASALGLPRQRANVIVEGVAGVTAAHAKSKLAVNLHSRVYSDSIFVDNMYVIPRITSYVPRLPCNKESLTHLNGLPLADPDYDQPGDIDILLGTGIVSYIMKNGIIRGNPDQPVASNSSFGWVVSGLANTHQQHVVRTHHTLCKLDELVHKFWEIEQLPPKKILSPEEQKAEDHFRTTHHRQEDGRYVVHLPFNQKLNSIGDTREQAVRRLHQLEKRFKKYPVKHQQYKDFMQEYIDLGHMELVTKPEERSKVVYIPHHFVVKEDSSTTKLRVVFDASMKSSSGVSLNDALLVGPTIQDDLYSQLIRFRSQNIALKADIAKMYRQFEVHSSDRDYQTILWRESEYDPIREYRLKTVTYGTACAPYLATRCLQQLADDEEKSFPRAAKLIKNHMYIDDFMGGSETKEEAISIYKELTQLCERGKLDIRKWCSSSHDVLNYIPTQMKEEVVSHEFNESTTVKALGIRWKPQDDYFYFDVEDKKPQKNTTKREILSDIARTFDPIGWLTPTTVIAKILFQDLWKETSDWDETCSDQIQERWNNYQQQLKNVKKIKIPRCILPKDPVDVQIHGFADSSETAMGCCVYIRYTTTGGIINSNLLTSKSKIAPLKQTSLPRLELNAAVLLAETMEAVMRCFDFPYTVHAWTDSMITLSWLTSTSRRWKMYVATRVAAIQDVIPAQCWRHIRSSDNPADLPSRGVLAADLINNKLWFHGPVWLATNSFPSSSQDEANEDEVLKEERACNKSTFAVNNEENYASRLFEFSSLEKIVSTTAWWRRYFAYLRSKQSCEMGPLSAMERKDALNAVVKFVQKQHFSEDIGMLRKNKDLSTKSKLTQLNPIISASGTLCVGGRLQNSPLSEENKHPAILPRHHEFTSVLIRHYHLKLLHGGFTLTLASLRRRFWILGGRDIVRFVLRKCTTCRKIKAQQSKQLMGNLPSARVTPNRPFLHCGVDFAGSFPVKMRRGRGAATDKCYMAVFVCFTTKAVHLEAVTSLSTDDFIACFKRFTSRRGIPSHLYSDCGTNFVGAEKELRKMMETQQNELQQQVSCHGTTWVFNPPSAPHQGGLWEAAVKSAKHHIKRVIGPANLTFEQFQTLLCNVEACLNSRPLCSLSSDPLDTDALTPGHFLIGEPLVAVPEGDLTTIAENRLSHWQHVQKMTQHFWRRWRTEYLTTLQQRQKWKRKERNLEVGDLVVVRDDLPPTKWKLGRVAATHPGPDGLVRKVTVKTANSEIIRPITKLCILFSNDE